MVYVLGVVRMDSAFVEKDLGMNAVVGVGNNDLEIDNDLDPIVHALGYNSGDYSDYILGNSYPVLAKAENIVHIAQSGHAVQPARRVDLKQKSVKKEKKTEKGQDFQYTESVLYSGFEHLQHVLAHVASAPPVSVSTYFSELILAEDSKQQPLWLSVLNLPLNQFEFLIYLQAHEAASIVHQAKKLPKFPAVLVQKQTRYQQVFAQLAAKLVLAPGLVLALEQD